MYGCMDGGETLYVNQATMLPQNPSCFIGLYAKLAVLASYPSEELSPTTAYFLP